MTADVERHLRQQFRAKKVLVVGGSGFLGRNLVRALEALGAEVSATGRMPAAPEPEPEPAPESASRDRTGSTRWLGQLDFGSLAVAQESVAGHDLVIDCIGRLGAAVSNLQPVLSLEQELRPQLNLVLACAESACPPTALFVSSRLVYGTPQYLPVDERHPVQPGSMYAIHKSTVEQYFRLLGGQGRMPFCIFRLSNPYGPFQRDDARSYGVVNGFFREAARGEALRVYGSGQQRRDYIFVDDVVEAMLRCAIEPRAHGKTFNLGTGESISLGQAAECIRAAAGSPAVSYVPWPSGELAVETGHYEGSVELLRNTIGSFNPRPFHQGVIPTLQHYQELAREHQPRMETHLATEARA